MRTSQQPVQRKSLPKTLQSVQIGSIRPPSPNSKIMYSTNAPVARSVYHPASEIKNSESSRNQVSYSSYIPQTQPKTQSRMLSSTNYNWNQPTSTIYTQNYQNQPVSKTSTNFNKGIGLTALTANNTYQQKQGQPVQQTPNFLEALTKSVDNQQRNTNRSLSLDQVLVGGFLSGWDAQLMKENIQAQQGDMSWRDKQEQSWKIPMHLQKQPILRDFGFPNPTIQYKIIPKVDDKMAFDVYTEDQNQREHRSGNLIIWKYHGGPNQKFYIQRQKSGRCLLINVSTGFVVAVRNSSSKNGQTILVNPYEEKSYQEIEVIPQGNSQQLFVLKTFNGKVLDVENQSTKNGANVVQYEANGGKNQIWQILPA